MDHKKPPDFKLLRIGKKVKRVSLQRYLLTKFLYEHNRITEADILCLFENQLWLESKCLKDSQFCQKFGKVVFDLSELMKNQNPEEITLKSLNRLASRLGTKHQLFIVPERNYSQWKSRFSGCFNINPIRSKEIRDFYAKQPPPKRSMGIGYRDKGSKRDLARDGSPDWTEISEDQYYQENRIEYEIDKCKNYHDIVHLFYREGLIGEKSLRDIFMGKKLSEGDSEAPEREEGV